jgi:hypothetical protein
MASTSEITVTPKNSKREIILVTLDGPSDYKMQVHALFQIKLKNGEIYALDLMGAANGYYEPITPMELYTKSRIDMNSTDWRMDAQPLGTTRKVYMLAAGIDVDNRVSGRKAEGEVLASTALNLKTSMELVIEIKKWLKLHSNYFGASPMLPREDFEKKKAELVNHLLKSIKDFTGYSE